MQANLRTGVAAEHYKNIFPSSQYIMDRGWLGVMSQFVHSAGPVPCTTEMIGSARQFLTLANK